MTNALIGYSGFVGTTLLKQAKFETLFRSTNINDIRGKTFGTVVCAGAPAQKWLANKEPENDKKIIDSLIECLKTVKCRMFILISTVDVFQNPIEAYEDTAINELGLNPYGLHRRFLEKFVENHFPNHLIVRLPGLVGPGLKKNIIFDFLNENNISQIESRNVFQFYPMVNLWFDIEVALKNKLKVIHLTAEPISVESVATEGFARKHHNEIAPSVINYDMRTRHSNLFAGPNNYQYSKRETIQAVRSYAQSESSQLKAGAKI